MITFFFEDALSLRCMYIDLRADSMRRTAD